MSAECSIHGCHLSGFMEDAYCPECKLAAYRAVEMTARDSRNSSELVGIAFRNAMRRLHPVPSEEGEQ